MLLLIDPRTVCLHCHKEMCDGSTITLPGSRAECLSITSCRQQSKQVLRVMRVDMDMDEQEMGEQYLKPLERGTTVSTWADLTGSLWQHLATQTQTHRHPPGNKDHGETFLQGQLTPHTSWDHYRPALKHQPVGPAWTVASAQVLDTQTTSRRQVKVAWFIFS